MDRPEDLWEAYRTDFYRLDHGYRKFYFSFDQLGYQNNDLSVLKDKIESEYQNTYLSYLSEKWDKSILKGNEWGGRLQSNFYKEEIEALIQKDKRVFIIISDGLRYEAGNELFRRAIEENRYDAELLEMKTMLPSVTSFGMAALLPHEKIVLNSQEDVIIDGLSSKNLAMREKILQKNGHKDSIAMSFDEVDRLTRNELRIKCNGKKIIYIYHNQIDAIGDQRITENAVFDAVEESIKQLKQLMDRLTLEVSATQLFVTGDHGFIYLRKPIQLSEKITINLNTNDVYCGKRFILSKAKIFEPSSLSFPLSKEIETEGLIYIPRGLNRYALPGGGYQYFHGGHLPQETMVPLLRIRTNRSKNDVPQVSIQLVSIIRTITNNIVWLDFLQTEAVSETLKEKRVKIWIEDDQGSKISNEVQLIADSENQQSQDRVTREKFVLLNKEYRRTSNYYLTIINDNDENDVIKEKFTIDIARVIE